MSPSILIVGSPRDQDGVHTRVAGRALLRGLEQRGVQWQIHLPGTGPMPDLAPYDGVFCFSHRVYRTNGYVRGALEIEALARSLGKAVINSVEHSQARHSDFLAIWRKHGVSCADFQHFESFEDIQLEYPLLVRRDGAHQGQDLFFVGTADEAKKIIQDRQADDSQPNLDLAIELIDVRDEHGRYNKYRSMVVGDRLIPVHALFSDHWLVNYHGRFKADETATQQGEVFARDGEQNVAEVLAAARLTGSDLLALDYAKRTDGSYVFWEANRHFLLLEDYGETQSEEYAKATGHADNGRSQMLEDLALALGDLVIERTSPRSGRQ